MGHAGAIVSGGKGTAAAKIAAFKEAGIGVAPTPSEMAGTLVENDVSRMVLNCAALRVALGGGYFFFQNGRRARHCLIGACR